MSISRNDQKSFAREIIAISERDTSAETLLSLSRLTSLLVSWTGEENSVAVNLSEYVHELRSRKETGEDSGWADEFRKTLEKDLETE